ncbi:hypothetical protein PR048_003173 [Dryococelus australis]|uniref:Uncharacterized protein n=1 Tax=Dryococelus australis TaxID=614101 RepID=A0ABQ9INS6_9NEOP|nr:hypothetical protein PR048_003173 [Dryococelus australis]
MFVGDRRAGCQLLQEHHTSRHLEADEATLGGYRTGDHRNYGPSLFTSHLGEPGSIPGRVTPGFSHVGIVPDDAAGRQVLYGVSRFPRPFTILTSNTLIGPQGLAVQRYDGNTARLARRSDVALGVRSIEREEQRRTTVSHLPTTSAHPQQHVACSVPRDYTEGATLQWRSTAADPEAGPRWLSGQTTRLTPRRSGVISGGVSQRGNVADADVGRRFSQDTLVSPLLHFTAAPSSLNFSHTVDRRPKLHDAGGALCSWGRCGGGCGCGCGWSYGGTSRDGYVNGCGFGGGAIVVATTANRGALKIPPIRRFFPHLRQRSARALSKGDSATCIKCAIGTKRKALNWSAVF